MICYQAKEAHSAYIIAYAIQYCTTDVMNIGNQTMFIFQYFFNSPSCKMSIEDNKLHFKTKKDIVLKPNAVLNLDLVLYTKTPIVPDMIELEDPPS